MRSELDGLEISFLTQGTVYDISHGQGLALSTEYGLHQNLNRILGTTGNSKVACTIRDGIRNFLVARDLPSAYRLQILADYAFHNAISHYHAGLENLINQAVHNTTTDGVAFMTQQEANTLRAWLRNLVAGQGLSDFSDNVLTEILNLCPQVTPLVHHLIG